MDEMRINYTCIDYLILQLHIDPPNKPNNPKQRTKLPVDPILFQRGAPY
uniref:Uncharacterized protein n=1 Tax=Arundo donax TaxID=35708 RepID=A0A0A9GTT3_ARUDO